MESIVREGVSGTIVLSGPWGSGKTTAALTLERPELTVILDLDQKSGARCEALGVEYIAPSGVGLANPLDYNLDAVAKWSSEMFARIASLGKTTIVIDNGTPLENAYHHVVGKDPARYGVKPKHAASGSYGGTNPGVGRLWENTVSFLQGAGYQNIVICMHMSQMWAGGAPIEKYRVKGNKVLTQLSNLSLVMIKSSVPNQPPAAIVGKEALGLISWNGETETYRTFMALPPRIPVFTWPVVYEYIALMKSGEKKEFAPDEVPSREEQERYSPWLSVDQRALILAVAKNPRFSLQETDAKRIVQAGSRVTTWRGLLEGLAPRGWTEKTVRAALVEKFGSGFDHSRVMDYFEYLKGQEPGQAGE